MKNVRYWCAIYKFAIHVFTLIELIIVVAIIAILASLLLPALKNAREYSLMIACSGNIRQIGLGMHSYAGDSDGWAPCAYAYDETPALAWYQFLGNGGYLSVDFANPVYRCPSFNNPTSNKELWGFGLRVVSQIPNGRIKILSPKPKYSQNSFSWNNPSALIFMGDSLTRDFKRQHYRLDDNNYAQASGGLPHTRHRKKANILFADNHVMATKGNELGDDVRSVGGWTWITKDSVPMGAYPW